MKIGDMIRLFNWEKNCFCIIKVYIFEKYSLRTFQRYVSWCLKWTHQKLLIWDHFPGTHSISNITKTMNAARQKKYFFRPAFKEESIGINR